MHLLPLSMATDIPFHYMTMPDNFKCKPFKYSPSSCIIRKVDVSSKMKASAYDKRSQCTVTIYTVTNLKNKGVIRK